MLSITPFPSGPYRIPTASCQYYVSASCEVFYLSLRAARSITLLQVNIHPMDCAARGPRNGEIIFRVCFNTMDIRLAPDIINLLLEAPRRGQTTQFDRFIHATLLHNRDEFTLL
jgi:hypothetical protein